MERDKALDLALASIEKQFGKGSVMKMGEKGSMKVETVPTGALALVWGEADPIATPFVADSIVRLRPDTVATRLAQVGHYPHWEAPEVTASAIDAAFGSF